MIFLNIFSERGWNAKTFFPRHPRAPSIYQHKLNEQNYGANLSNGNCVREKVRACRTTYFGGHFERFCGVDGEWRWSSWSSSVITVIDRNGRHRYIYLGLPRMLRDLPRPGGATTASFERREGVSARAPKGVTGSVGGRRPPPRAKGTPRVTTCYVNATTLFLPRPAGSVQVF